ETSEPAVIARTPPQQRRHKSLKDIGAFEIAKSVTAWICLQRMNKKYYEEKALQACGESLLASFSASARLHHADSQLGLENGGPIIEELQDDDVVVDGESRRESADLIYAHVGSGPSETTTQPPSFDPLSQERLFQNIRRYIRFSSGAYGKFAMDFFAPNALSFNERKELARKAQSSDSAHINHAFYSTYTARPMPEVFHTTYHNQKAGENRLLSEVSSVPRILPANKTHYNPTFYLILDHPNKSVVLCLRGTLSLHDLFVDLTCESQEVQIQGAPYLVHSGMYRAAQRVSLPADQWLAAVQEAELPSRASSSDLPNLFRADPRPPFIHEAVLAGLQAHPGYSLVVTGHSLGAGLAALITLAWGDANTGIVSASSGFPSGTKLHCFAYASPAIVATVDPVSRQTRSTQEFHRLVTSVTAGTDFVPSFGLGSVRDVAGVVARMHDAPGLASAIVARYVQSKTVSGLGAPDVEAVQELHGELHDDCFGNSKLFPIGRHFWIKEEAESGAVDVREVKRVDDLFGNLLFGPTMCSDHMPNVYEDLIRGL
ncbi:Alpha/Beta hydrolase protein, partial [Chytriomyces sp. MP71]